MCLLYKGHNVEVTLPLILTPISRSKYTLKYCIPQHGGHIVHCDSLWYIVVHRGNMYIVVLVKPKETTYTTQIIPPN